MFVQMRGERSASLRYTVETGYQSRQFMSLSHYLSGCSTLSPTMHFIRSIPIASQSDDGYMIRAFIMKRLHTQTYHNSSPHRQGLVLLGIDPKH
jgi:hypothetical protein